MTDSLITLGAVQSIIARDDRSLTLDCGGPLLQVTILTPRLVRVRIATSGTFAPRRSWAVAAPDEGFAPLAVQFNEDDEALSLSTDLLTVRVERSSALLSFVDAQGTAFCADTAAPAWRPGELRLSKSLDPADHCYGFGERTMRLDRRWRRLVNWTSDPAWGHGPGTDPLYIAIPVGMIARPGLAYGFFFNNTWRSSIDLGLTEPNQWFVQAENGELDYYVAYGPTPAEVAASIGQLLGTTPMPPIWALGYHQSRWGYRSEAEFRTLATEFRERNLPCDAFHFDIDYMQGYRVFTWNAENFPAPQQLLSDLREQGFRAVTIIDPGVKHDPNYTIYREGLEQGMFVRRADGTVFHGYVWPDSSAFPDFIREDVRSWWADGQAALVQAGVSGIWNDMNEPTVFQRPFSEGHSTAGTIDLDALQGDGEDTAIHAEVHNLYGLMMSRASYEGLRRDLNGDRPFVLTRSAYAGVQRYSACWMGDNTSWWEHMEISLPQLMGMGLSGVPFVGVDIGGFFDNASPELFARWMQLGAFMPFCRGHSCAGTQPHEPWVFGPEVESITREYLGLRYSLLPYLYAAFYEAATSGAPIWRPLFYGFPEDEAAYTVQDQVLVGRYIMVAPVYRAGAEYRHVYLPQGDWYDWWTGEVISSPEGPSHVLEYAPLDRMPIYVRAGAIIPRIEGARHTDDWQTADLTLDLFPGDGDLLLYEDDGKTTANENGVFSTTLLRQQRNGDEIVVTIGKRNGPYRTGTRRLTLRVAGSEQSKVIEDTGEEQVVRLATLA
jgi:alpha-glucosidase